MNTVAAALNADSLELRTNPQLVANRKNLTMVQCVKDELRRCTSFDFSVAFVTSDALGLLKQSLQRDGLKGRLITSNYLGFNEPNAFRELLKIKSLEVFIYEPKPGVGFHPKGYVFRDGEETTAIIGSSNLTRKALSENREWNLRFTSSNAGHLPQQIEDEIVEQIAQSVPLTHEWIDHYEKTRVARVTKQAIDLADEAAAVSETIIPNEMQAEALLAIDNVRNQGERRALVISATGTGKTILAALVARKIQPKKMLFLVHREQILQRAIEEFKKVLGGSDSDYGLLANKNRQIERKYVFATVQTLANEKVLSALERDLFDLIIVDEVHRAGATMHLRVIDYFEPDFLLGLTATPERTDGFNVFDLFDHNVPYEIRLNRALENNMLVPFDYYGVTDYINENGESIDETSDLAKLVMDERVDHIVNAIDRYGFVDDVRGLMFCSNVAEASELSAELNAKTVNGRKLRTVALTGNDSVEHRNEQVRRLENGELDYILTVDIFNEGIDIRSVNQIVMLRNTQSSIVFTQQLGRGLRKSSGKDHLRVIDFIGNYKNNFLIPIALFGNSSLDKDSIRKDLQEAEAAGCIAGISSVNFDPIARKRILDALAETKLNSAINLKQSIRTLEERLGRAPWRYDFARFDTANPVVVATSSSKSELSNYWSQLHRFKFVESEPNLVERNFLNLLDCEILPSKRPHDVLLLEGIIEGNVSTRQEFAELLETEKTSSSEDVIRSAERTLTLEFFTETERRKYGNQAILRVENNQYSLTDEFRKAFLGSTFKKHVVDIIETTKFLVRKDYSWSGEMVIGSSYTRKDVSRMLNFRTNQAGTLNGYSLDKYSGTCPIFITYHKSDDISASVNYEDKFLDESTIRWFTKSGRRLDSAQEARIIGNEIPLYVFVKKDDADGSGFYYIGQATSRDAYQNSMVDDHGKQKPVVTMKLDLESPVESALYGYLTGNNVQPLESQSIV